MKIVVEMRIDKFIWCVRLAKTRSLGADLCNRNQIKINNYEQKPSKEVASGDIISVRATPIWRVYTVIDLPKSRVGAKLVKDYLKEITPEKDLMQLAELRRLNQQNRLVGLIGRPTKKDRRDLDEFNKTK